MLNRSYAFLETRLFVDSSELRDIFDNALAYVEYGKLVTKAEYSVENQPGRPADQPDFHGTDVRGNPFEGTA